MGLRWAPKGETCLKRPWPWLQPALPRSPSSPYYTAQHLKGHENTEDRGGGPKTAVRAWQGGVPFPGVSILHATGMQ